MIYFVLFFALFFAALNWKYLKADNQRKLFYICLAVLILFSGLRSGTVGVDTAGGYYAYYLYVKSNIRLTWLEPAWELLNRISIILGWGYSGVLMLACLMILLPVGYIIKRKCSNACLGLAVYYGLCMVLYSYNLIRQCVASAWIFLCIYFYEQKKYTFSVLAMLIAASFHNSFFIVLFLIVFANLKLRYKTVAFLFVLSFIMGLAFNRNVISFLSGGYAHYLSNTGGLVGFRNSLTIPIIFAIMVNSFFLILLFFRSNAKIDDIWYKSTVLGIIMMNLTLQLGQGSRIVLYFSQAQTIFMPSYINSLRIKQNKYFVGFLYFLFLLINFARILFSQADSLLPYRTFWMN